MSIYERVVDRHVGSVRHRRGAIGVSSQRRHPALWVSVAYL